MNFKQQGADMYKLATRLFPINRSLTGKGVAETLSILGEYLPIEEHKVPSGTEVLDWIVPDEWNIEDAYVLNENGEKIIDFKKNNLHVLGCSEPFEGEITLAELKEHLYTQPDQKDAIPFVTSYYNRRWGFCISQNQYDSLSNEKYYVKIDSQLEPGFLNYAEIYIEGKQKQEILISTYICHPSMANDNLSGPVLAIYLGRLLSAKENYYSYRILFIPETIGSITYLHFHKEDLTESVVGGYVLTCVGDPGDFSYLMTREGNTLVDRVTKHVLRNSGDKHKFYSYLDRGSDERQYNSLGINLPIGSLMRSKYATFPEYHTSNDNLDFITPDALGDSLKMYVKCLDVFEKNHFYRVTVLGEPQLGKRGLYPTVAQKGVYSETRVMMNFLAYADGRKDLIDIAETINIPVWELYPIIELLEQHNLIERLSIGL